MRKRIRKLCPSEHSLNIQEARAWPLLLKPLVSSATQPPVTIFTLQQRLQLYSLGHIL